MADVAERRRQAAQTAMRGGHSGTERTGCAGSGRLRRASDEPLKRRRRRQQCSPAAPPTEARPCSGRAGSPSSPSSSLATPISPRPKPLSRSWTRLAQM
eukprot:365431-Chlamydomonas_euryale.AAC.9